jgi:CHAT domain-containing protein
VHCVQPGIATEMDDRLLTASEIAILKLDADLVVLSACDTAAGDQIGAEGLSGLARAFFHAGARSMLVSHWAVDRLDTKTLMEVLFQEIEKEPNIRRSDALRRAMLARITSATGREAWNAYPSRWAAFDLVGAQ